ncbi:glycosyltransferase family protein [Cylindrospermopsis curvispora]|uniref:Glycosyltransferase n=1 Tax=Cylindrospermopsis curvispora GIHE-G1 TaxID=2666332 RepID=A0A7H0F1M8_9CYAN|nr:glycosyltransferase [Cylindrospermopsis curvispora]QNP29944.1 glycosyltransferase [Cylindrospermopsis curvispora GIHE-G1]
MTYNKKQPLKRILYIQYTNPAGYPPLEHSSRILGSNRWEVLFLGTGAEGANALKFAPHPQITVYQIPFCRPGWRQKLHYIKFCLWVVMWVLRWEPQWIYASDILICPLAYILTFLPQVKVIYHEHDSPTTTPESLFLRWCSQARIKLASAANFSILPNQARLEKFVSQTRTHKPVFCVWNCPDKEEVVSQRLQYRHDNDIWVLYHGSIVPERLPMTVIDAISRLPKKVKLRVIGYETLGSRGYVNKLKVVARELGFTDRLQLIEALPRKKLLKWSEQSDIGLAFMPITSDDVNLVSMTGASNKPFDYLACGLPLVVSSLPDWEQMYVEPGYGLACNPEDADSIADVLRWYLEHPTEMRVMGERGRQRILDEWNYENQFETIIKNIGT